MLPLSPSGPLLLQNVIWCPGLDDEMRSRSQRYIDALPNMYPRVLEGGKGGLVNFDPRAKLYILSHGHSRMPMFTTKAGRWTAAQLADLLVQDGLHKDQRDIELLVCHAGESVNTREGGTKLMAIAQQASAAKSQGNNNKVETLRKKFESLSAKQQQPVFFETNPEKLLLPMAAQLSQALRERRFTHFRIISYKCPVAQFSPDGHVYLDLRPKGGDWGISADSPQGSPYRVIWH